MCEAVSKARGRLTSCLAGQSFKTARAARRRSSSCAPLVSTSQSSNKSAFDKITSAIDPLFPRPSVEQLPCSPYRWHPIIFYIL